jgi:hypothetical protein
VIPRDYITEWRAYAPWVQDIQVDRGLSFAGRALGVSYRAVRSDGIDPEELLKKADMALYQAKSDGRGVFRFFRPEIEASQQARHVVELELHKALAESQFELFRADLGCYPLMPCRKSPSYTYRAGTVLGLAKRALEACNLMPEWATIYGRPGRSNCDSNEHSKEDRPRRIPGLDARCF